MKIILTIFFIAVAFTLGAMMGSLIVHFPNKITDEDVFRCERAGGHYSLFYSNYNKQYVSNCKVEEREIKSY